MAQHFLLSAAARTLSVAKIMRMSELGVENVFRTLRWPDGKPVCPRCRCTIYYECRRRADEPRWRCKACRGDFSLTSGTLFAWHKLPLRSYLLAIAVLCNEVKGKSGTPTRSRVGTRHARLGPRARRAIQDGLMWTAACVSSDSMALQAVYRERARESGQMRPYVRPMARLVPLAIMGARTRVRYQSSWRARSTHRLTVLRGLS